MNTEQETENASLSGIVMEKQELEHHFPEVIMKSLGQHTKVKALCTELYAGDWKKVPSSDLYMLY